MPLTAPMTAWRMPENPEGSPGGSREYYQQHQAVIDRWTGGTLPPGTSLPPETDEETREILSRYYALKGEYEAADEAYEGARTAAGMPGKRLSELWRMPNWP